MILLEWFCASPVTRLVIDENIINTEQVCTYLSCRAKATELVKTTKTKQKKNNQPERKLETNIASNI